MIVPFNKLKGSVTEVIYDFVFTPPQAQRGLQSSALPSTEAPLCTALFVFYLSNSTYVTASYCFKDKMQQRSSWLAVQIVLLCGGVILPTG